MKLELDENIGSRGLGLLRDAGHGVATGRGQGLAGAQDSTRYIRLAAPFPMHRAQPVMASFAALENEDRWHAMTDSLTPRPLSQSG